MDPRNGSTGPPPKDKQNKAHRRDAPPSSEPWRWAAPERKGDGRRRERVDMNDERGDQANRQPTDGARGVGVKGRGGRCGRQRRGGGGAPRCVPCVTDHPIRHPPAAMARGGLAPMASLPAARDRPPAPLRGVNKREWRRGGCAGLGLRGGHWGNEKKKKKKQPGSRFCRDLYRARARAAPAPRRVRPRPPSGGCWRRRVAVGWWPIRGTRGGVRKRRARRRGARAHAAADRGPSAPPVPPAAVALDPAADSPTRWGGWSEVGTGGKVVRCARRAC